MNNSVALRPLHYASVSGGKDSLYMLKVIMSNPSKYPLDLIVHFELEIDWPFIKKSVDSIQRFANSFNIPFMVFRPRRSYNELFGKWGLPSRLGRWCNSSYKLDCKLQLEEFIRSLSCRPVAYIGFCADEIKRFKYCVGSWNPEEKQDICYPFAQANTTDSFIFSSAKG